MNLPGKSDDTGKSCSVVGRRFSIEGISLAESKISELVKDLRVGDALLARFLAAFKHSHGRKHGTLDSLERERV